MILSAADQEEVMKIVAKYVKDKTLTDDQKAELIDCIGEELEILVIAVGLQNVIEVLESE